jgi:hypothetical protein
MGNPVEGQPRWPDQPMFFCRKELLQREEKRREEKRREEKRREEKSVMNVFMGSVFIIERKCGKYFKVPNFLTLFFKKINFFLKIISYSNAINDTMIQMKLKGF